MWKSDFLPSTSKPNYSQELQKIREKMHGTLLLSLVTSIYALRLVQDTTDKSNDAIECTTIENIQDNEIFAPDMEPIKLKDWDVSVLVYSKEDDLISEAIQKGGGWDRDGVQKICSEFIKYGGKGNILDVGGNIGSFALPLAACLKENGKNSNRVITIEGAPWNAKSAGGPFAVRSGQFRTKSFGVKNLNFEKLSICGAVAAAAGAL